VLALLNERPMHGYEMIQELDTRTAGMWRPSPGSIYPTLQLLEDEGLIVSEQTEGRKRFTLTDAGREEAAQAAERAPWSELADQDTVSAAHEARSAIAGVIGASGEVRASGTEAQWAQALEVLKDAKRRLYQILASDES
jgi:DNA-binding PadR family transcriptional regulator